MKPNPQTWAGARYAMPVGDVIVLGVHPRGRGYRVVYVERAPGRSGRRCAPQEQFLRMVAGR